MKIDPRWIGRKKNMRRWASAHGIPIPSGFRINPVCGKSCTQLIRRIETKAWGVKSVTGKWSPKLAALVNPAMTFRDRAVVIARGEKGVKEHPAGSNDGPRVRQYQKVSGAYHAPWCASFVAWCFETAKHPLSGFNLAYVPSYVHAARAKQHGLRLVGPGEVEPGDLACFDWQKDGVADHIGIVSRRVDAGGGFTSVEGNTAVGNDSNGGEVMERTRNLSQVTCFIRVVG